MKWFLLRRVHVSWVLVLVCLGVVLGCCLGVVLRVWWFESFWWVLVALALIGVCFWRCRFLVVGLAFLGGVVIGGWRAAGMVGDFRYIGGLVGRTVEVEGVVYEDPDVDGSEVKLRLSRLVFGGEVEVTGSLYATVSGGGAGDVARSDKVVLRGKLGEGFGSFAGSMYRPEVVEVAKPDPPDVALSLRDGFAEGVRAYVSESEVDLGLGYLLGMRRALPAEIVEMLKVVGLTHIVVASGYNLSVLMRAARRIFKRISRFAALFFGLALVVCFVGVTGLTPSMVRAGLVAGLSLLVWFFGRKFHPAKLLVLVGAATLVYNPMYLVDLGWLLSFASFAGVMLVGPVATRYFYGEREPNFVAAVVVETMAAQICCLPILLYFFGSFSLISVLANVLILPTIPFVMLGLFVTGALAWLPVVAGTLGTLSGWVLRYHLWVVKFFGEMTEFLVSIPTNNTLVFLLYVPVVGLTVWWWRKSGASLRPVNLVE